MIFLENFRIAFSALRANKMRSILTTLGIIIGVGAVIAVVSIVQGLQYTFTKEFQGVGATFIMVMPEHPRNESTARQVRLTWDDGLAIRETLPAGVANVRQSPPWAGITSRATVSGSRSGSALRLEQKAIHLPSGDHAMLCGALVRLVTRAVCPVSIQRT